MPQRVPLGVYRGDSHHWVLTLWSDQAATVPIDMAGVSPKAEIRQPGGPVVATLDCAITPPNAITVTLAAADSAALPGLVGWDLQLTFPDGSVRTVAAGPITVTADVTDSVMI
jgi:hypothetical protein